MDLGDWSVIHHPGSLGLVKKEEETGGCLLQSQTPLSSRSYQHWSRPRQAIGPDVPAS